MITLLNGPVYVPDHVRDAINQPVCDLRHPRFQEAYAFCRSKTLELLHAQDYSAVLASGSGSFGLELVIRSCVRGGDTVLALMTGTYGARLAEMAKTSGQE